MSEAGDVQLILGDCLEILSTLEAGTVDFVCADPPYGIDFQSARRTDRSKWKPKIANDKTPFVAWLPEAFRVTRTGGAIACFCVWQVQDAFRDAIESAGYTVRSQVIWDRDWHGMGDLGGVFAPQHDVIWFASKGDFKFPGSRPKSVLRHQRVAPDKLVHPNEKPVKLVADLVRSCCPPGGVCLDPFLGSGASGIACRQAGRLFIGIELDPIHYETARRRILGAPGETSRQQSLFASEAS